MICSMPDKANYFICKYLLKKEGAKNDDRKGWNLILQVRIILYLVVRVVVRQEKHNAKVSCL